MNIVRISDINEHLNCFNYTSGEKQAIEPVRIVKGEKGNESTDSNVVLFIQEGRIRYSFRACPEHEGQKGHIIFIASGTDYSYHALTNVKAVVFRIYTPISLCANYTVDMLYKMGKAKQTDEYKSETQKLGILETNVRMWHFVDGVADCITDGLKCHCWFEMKIKELFLLIRVYYSKQEIRDFLYPILSKDTAFSEHVRKYWRNFRTVNELAAFMNMTPKRFSTQFAAVFGKTPYKWITEARADSIRREITATNKQFKQIAIEHGFTSDSLFTRFCRTMFDQTPTNLREKANSIGGEL